MRQVIGDATLLTGDCLDVMRGLPDQSVQCCITSPPYYGLRDYKVDGQIGLEPTMDEYVARLVDAFSEVRRVLADDGTVWLNLGDSYNTYAANRGRGPGLNKNSHEALPDIQAGFGLTVKALSNKQLLGMPWRVAFALQADGWWLRQDIIWHKPNPMPESVRDRCTKAHEYIFLLAKSEHYFYDQDAIKESASYNTHERLSRAARDHKSMPDELKNGIRPRGRAPAASWNGSTFDGPRDLAVRPTTGRKMAETGSGIKNNESFNEAMALRPDFRNKRSVWTVPSAPFSGAHFAVFPPDLIRPCVMAGCPAGGTILDPFSGSGTTGMVALQEGRKYIGIELNPEYQALAVERITPHAAQNRLFP